MQFGTFFFSITLQLFHHHASAVAVAAAVAVAVAVVVVAVVATVVAKQIYHEKDILDIFFRHKHPCAKDCFKKLFQLTYVMKLSFIR